MPFCSQCGASVTEEMSFCPGCGTRLAIAGEAAAEMIDFAAEVTSLAPQYTGEAVNCLDSGDYKVVLVGRGTCSAVAAAEFIEDLLGYSSVQARRLLHMAPAEAACGLTLTQARYIAQALTEYGMEAAVTDGLGGTLNLPKARTSVFDSYGNLLPAVAVALAVLTGANRVRRISTWGMGGGLFPRLFGLGFRRPAPPRHMRRPPMRPAPRRPVPPPAPRPFAPRPAARRPSAPRPAAPRPPRGGMGGFGGPGRGPGGPGGRRR